MRTSATVLLSLYIGVILPNLVFACSGSGADIRLEAFCWLETSFNRSLRLDQVVLISNKLSDVGQPKLVPQAPPSKKYRSIFYPSLRWSNNINGGNPEGSLRIGDVSFVGDKTLNRKSGILFGLNYLADGKLVYPQEGYLTYGFQAGYEYNLAHEMAVSSAKLNGCATKRLLGWWYFDACGASSRDRKVLSDQKSSELALASSTIWSNKQGMFQLAKVGLERHYLDGFNQNLATAHSELLGQSGQYLSLGLSFGAPVLNHLATRQFIDLRVGVPIKDRVVVLSINHRMADGGLMLGYERSEETVSATVSFSAFTSVRLSLGYIETNSSISYFDDVGYTASLSFF